MYLNAEKEQLVQTPSRLNRRRQLLVSRGKVFCQNPGLLIVDIFFPTVKAEVALPELFHIVLSVPGVYQYIDLLPAEKAGLFFLLGTGGSTVS